MWRKICLESNTFACEYDKDCEIWIHKRLYIHEKSYCDDLVVLCDETEDTVEDLNHMALETISINSNNKTNYWLIAVVLLATVCLLLLLVIVVKYYTKQKQPPGSVL